MLLSFDMLSSAQLASVLLSELKNTDFSEPRLTASAGPFLLMLISPIQRIARIIDKNVGTRPLALHGAPRPHYGLVSYSTNVEEKIT